jgi:hypothetical protein
MSGNNILLFVAGLLLSACATTNAQAQQRDPNQPRPTPTPSPARPVMAGHGRVVGTPGDVGKVVSATRTPGIYGQIRWRKELGLPFDPSRARPPYPICNTFRVRITVQEAVVPGTFGRTQALGNVLAPGNPTEDGHFYVCVYAFPDKGLLPRNQAMMVSAELDGGGSPAPERKPWSVGSNATPPPGQQRTIIIIGGHENGITLTDDRARATVDFEVVYRPAPTSPR